MTRLDIIRKTKSLFMKWKLHGIIEPFTGVFQNTVYMSKLSQWRNRTKVNGFNDWYQGKWDYSRRYNLYEAVSRVEKLDSAPLDYFEFGVCGGQSFKWWLEHNKNADSKFYGFDTFEGLPEAFGPFGKGSMAAALESLHITDPRSSFYKGLFQDTLVPFLDQYKGGRKKLIHFDADLFSATLFSLSQLYRFLKEGDILLFDEFAVPKHEFRAFKIFTESFYINYEVIGAANNYLFLAVKIKK
ncbi:MAG: class I SAM-dependent methyltransferase [Bacteroidia bacterium]|nr:class I SAM-dependent methyltransferase [Bacteroidia bacterium]